MTAAPVAQVAPADRRPGWAVVYCWWTAAAIGLALLHGGFSDENITRLGVLAFIAVQFAFRPRLVDALPRLAPRTRFIVYGTALAAVVEGLHMISKPAFDTLRIGPDTPLAMALWRYAIDLAFTVPAYVAIFGVIWFFIARYRYGLWLYIVLAGLGQALGDGGIYVVAGSPQLALFLPYIMTNYHAVNVIPFLAVREALPAERNDSRARLLMVPALIVVYFVCGALIKTIGRAYGLEPG